MKKSTVAFVAFIVGGLLGIGVQREVQRRDAEVSAGEMTVLVEKMEKHKEKISGAIIATGAALYECRAGRGWLGTEAWLEMHPNCGVECVTKMLMQQAEKAKEDGYGRNSSALQ
jgi:hypothetical protein